MGVSNPEPFSESNSEEQKIISKLRYYLDQYQTCDRKDRKSHKLINEMKSLNSKLNKMPQTPVIQRILFAFEEFDEHQDAEQFINNLNEILDL
jgi:hypothetical protein